MRLYDIRNATVVRPILSQLIPESNAACACRRSPAFPRRFRLHADIHFVIDTNTFRSCPTCRETHAWNSHAYVRLLRRDGGDVARAVGGA